MTKTLPPAQVDTTLLSAPLTKAEAQLLVGALRCVDANRFQVATKLDTLNAATVLCSLAERISGAFDEAPAPAPPTGEG